MAALTFSAGYWYIFVSRPLVQFILIRGISECFIWLVFSGRVRLETQSYPTHPDRAAGLGFLGGVFPPFSPLLLAHGALLAD